MEALTVGQLTLLNEIAEAASSHAATALSQLLNRQVGIKNSRVEWFNVSSIPKLSSNPDAAAAALSFRILGDARGKILILFHKNDAQSLLSQLLIEKELSYPFTREYVVSTLKEVGNILAGAYLNTVGRLTNIVLIPSVPAIFQDSFRESLNFILGDWDLEQEKVLIMETEFLADSRVSCQFCLIPDIDLLQQIVDL